MAKRRSTAPRATTLLLWRLDGESRFAVVYDGSPLKEGRLVLDPSETPEAAQAELLRAMQSETGYEYIARWASPQPSCWTARLKVRRRPR